MSLTKVEGFNSLRKDTANGGVVNVDKMAFNAHKAQKAIALQNVHAQKSTQDSVTRLQDEINTLKTDLTDIKQMLIQILDKR